jgi:hypothetical protein
MKTFFGTFIGIISAFIVMLLIEKAGRSSYPMPTEFDFIHPYEIPTGLLIAVIIAHSVSLLVGLIIARLIDRETKFPIYIIAIFLLFGTVANMFFNEHPLWFMIADLGFFLLIAVSFILIVKKRDAKKVKS